MTFAELIKSKGFSQSKLSRVADVSQSNLSIYSNYIAYGDIINDFIDEQEQSIQALTEDNKGLIELLSQASEDSQKIIDENIRLSAENKSLRCCGNCKLTFDRRLRSTCYSCIYNRVINISYLV
jgi:glycyl-tRNA synthetase alpha subunit